VLPAAVGDTTQAAHRTATPMLRDCSPLLAVERWDPCCGRGRVPLPGRRLRPAKAHPDRRRQASEKSRCGSDPDRRGQRVETVCRCQLVSIAGSGYRAFVSGSRTSRQLHGRLALLSGPHPIVTCSTSQSDTISSFLGRCGQMRTLPACEKTQPDRDDVVFLDDGRRAELPGDTGRKCLRVGANC
jgi:hypothetical protein